MNRFKLFWILVAALFAGCDNEDFDPDYYAPSINAHYLAVSQDDFLFGTAVSRSGPLSGIGDTNVSMGVTANPTADAYRTGIFYLDSKQAGWNYSIPMNVQQPAATPYALFSNGSNSGSITFSGKAEQRIYSVESNCTWSVQSSATWLKVQKNSSDRLQISTEVNSTGYSRSATVKVTFKGNTIATLNVTQQMPNITVSTSIINTSISASNYKVSFEAEADWTATTSDTWLQISSTYGKAGQNEITISVSPNTSTYGRTGYVYFKIGNRTIVSLAIDQEGISLTLEKSSCTLSSGTEASTVKLTSNTDWKIKSVPEWLTVVPMEGKGDTTLKLIPKNNPDITSRSATITAYVEGVSLSQNLTVTQKGKSFSYSNGNLVCSDDAQTLKVSIKSDGYWTATTSDTWITLNPGAQQGDADLAVTVTENMAENSRNGSIKLTIGSRVYQVTVTQSGKFYKLNATTTSIGSTGGKLVLDLYTNSSWTASVEGAPTWLTISPTSGKDSASINMAFQDNPSVKSRTATVVVTASNGKSVKATVTQAARYLTVSHQNVTFFAKGGTVDNIEIKTDGKYEVTSQGNWFTFKVNADNTISVTAAENTTTNLREGTLKIKLTDVKDGELSLTLPVVQATQGGNFVKNDYSQDVNWNLGGNSSATFKVTGYSTDKNWDSDFTNKQVTVTIKGFDPDKNWDN